METIDALSELVARHAPGDGIHETGLPGVVLLRAGAPTDAILTVHQPAACIIVQGAKQVMLGDQVYRYDTAKHLVVSVDVPLVGQVVEASPARPYLCIRLDLDLGVLNALVLDEPAAPPAEPSRGVHLSPTTPELIDAAARMLRLLDRPRDAAALAPLIRREIHYRLLTGDHGATVRHIAAGESKLAQVSRAIAWIKANYQRPFSVEAVAREARMSPSAFHQHFKAVTAMSPLQYQKQLRLQAARRLMVGEARDAQAAGFEVGYDSPSQFSREYARLFGAPPAADAARLRASGQAYLVA
jgi:AraC-like DNA-binding protein